MSISLLDNLSIKKKSPNVERDLFNTIEEMVAFSENYLPDVFECNVKEDGNRYRYNVSNSVDEVLGKWRLVGGNSSVNLEEYYKRTETDDLLTGYVTKEDGKGLSANDYTTLEKEKLASLENYDDSDIQSRIATNEQAASEIKTLIGAGNLNTTDQTLIGAVNELKLKTDDTTLSDRVAANESAINIINGDSSVAGSIKKSVSTCLIDSKAYTDAQIQKMSENAAITCDEKPTYFAGTITYIKDGVPKSTEETSTWFYYTENEKLMQTIFIEDVDGEVTEISIVSAGGVDFEDYVSKSLDVVSTYSGDEADTSKIPDLAAVQALEQKVKADVDLRVKASDIYDGLDSTSTTAPLSANQGKVLNDTIGTKLDKTFTGDEVGNKPLVTDSMGNVILGSFDETINNVSSNAPQNKAVQAELDKKFDISQDVSKAGYVAVVGEDGNMTLAESTTLGGTAEVVKYSNDSYPELSNVDLALDKILAKIYYVTPSILSFSMNPATTEYEMGTVIPADTLTFSWSVNKEIKNQALTDCQIAVDDRSAVYGSDLSSTKTFILNVSDGENTATATKKISFLNKVYWGNAAEPEEYNSAFILGLSNNKLVTTSKADYNFTAGEGEYGYFAVPKAMKFSSIWVNGFQADVEEVTTISFTNASGFSTSYTILRTSKTGLGSFTATVK